MKNITALEAIQNKLGSDLAAEVAETVEALRHPTLYDLPTLTAFNVLCRAIEYSALGTSGTAVTLFGIYESLREMRDAVRG
jgi:hypothetical protein